MNIYKYNCIYIYNIYIYINTYLLIMLKKNIWVLWISYRFKPTGLHACLADSPARICTVGFASVFCL